MSKGKLQFLSSLLLLPLCFSCGINTDFQKEGTEVELLYNGDALKASGKDVTSYCLDIDADQMIERILDGESVFLILAANDCSHCAKFKPYLQEFLAQVPMEIYLCNETAMASHTAYSALSAKLYEAFPSLPEMKLSYPSGYFIQSPTELTSVSFSGQYSSTAALSDYLSSRIYLQNVYRFENEAGFADFLKERGTIGYIYHDSTNEVSEEFSNIKKPMGLFQDTVKEEGYYRYGGKGLEKITKEDALGILC